MKLICLAVTVAVIAGCAAPPKVDKSTRYSGNVHPLQYQHVSGAPVRRNATAEVAGAVAGGVGYAAGGAAVGGAIDPNAATQAAVRSMPNTPATSAPACEQVTP